jgi:hypothetical protein
VKVEDRDKHGSLLRLGVNYSFIVIACVDESDLKDFRKKLFFDDQNNDFAKNVNFRKKKLSTS